MGQNETSSSERLPGIFAFSRRTARAVVQLDEALSQEDVIEAANACHWLMDELDDVRDNLVDLMSRGQSE